MIDSLLHPLIDRNPALMITDTILHGIVEQNPSETTIKFIRYSLPKIVEEIMRNDSTRLKANTYKCS